MTKPSEPQRDEQWVRDRFGDVGDRPSDDVVVDPEATDAPDVGHPK